MDRKLQSEIDAVVVRRGTVLSALSCKLSRVPTSVIDDGLKELKEYFSGMKVQKVFDFR